MNAAYQLAFCYKVGFGAPSNKEQSRYWLQKAERPAEDLEIGVNFAKENDESWQLEKQ
jgi:hypothetical protein